MHTGGHREEDFDGFGAISNLDKSFPLLVDRLGMLHSYHGRNIQYIRPYEKLLISANKLEAHQKCSKKEPNVRITTAYHVVYSQLGFREGGVESTVERQEDSSSRS